MLAPRGDTAQATLYYQVHVRSRSRCLRSGRLPDCTFSAPIAYPIPALHRVPQLREVAASTN